MKTEQFVAFIKSCDAIILERQNELAEAKKVRIDAFRGLANICDYRDPDKIHCRHEALKREANTNGVTAFKNGCHRQICPLLK